MRSVGEEGVGEPGLEAVPSKLSMSILCVELAGSAPGLVRGCPSAIMTWESSPSDSRFCCLAKLESEVQE